MKKAIIVEDKYVYDCNEGPYEELFEEVVMEQYHNTIYLRQTDEILVPIPPGKFEAILALSTKQAESLYDLLGEALGKNINP